MNDGPREPSPASVRLVDALRPLTPFAEAIVTRQVERAGLTVATLTDADVPRVAAMILVAAKMFLDPPQLAQLKRAIAP